MNSLAAALVLIFILHLIDKHNRWKVAAKITTCLLTVTGLIYAAYFAWNINEGRKREAQRIADETQRKADVQTCLGRYKKADETTDTFAEIECSKDPKSEPREKLASENHGQKNPIRLKVKWDTQLTTLNHGHTFAAYIQAGDFVTLLMRDDSFVRVKTQSGLIGWTDERNFYDIQEQDVPK